jgi:hypothetical protein
LASAVGKEVFLDVVTVRLEQDVGAAQLTDLLLVRLIMPWRLPAWAALTLPLAVILKRFLAPDLVLILGILLSCKTGRKHAKGAPAGGART